MTFTMVKNPGKTAIVNTIVNKYIVNYGGFIKFTISLFTIHYSHFFKPHISKIIKTRLSQCELSAPAQLWNNRRIIIMMMAA